LPNWLLARTFENKSKSQSPIMSPTNSKSIHSSPTNVNKDSLEATVRQLQDDLSKTKQQLIEQQTIYLQLESQHRQDAEEKTRMFTSSLMKIYKEFESLLKQSLVEQRDSCLKEFKALLDKHRFEQEEKLRQQFKDYEVKLVDLQEGIIKHTESEFEDMDIKVKKIVNGVLRDEQEKEKAKLKSSLDQIESKVKLDTEKYVQNYFKTQSELFKEQIKTGIQQEHLIHKDMINSKLEKLCKASEEKRRSANTLFARHLSGFNFFVDNAQKQLSILKEAHKDLFKNNETIDSYEDYLANSTSGDQLKQPTSSLSSLSLSAFSFSNANSNLANSSTTQNLFKFEPDQPDENLLDDV
jgi:hypothetical protein